MNRKLKPLKQQVMVITGASSGIGLTTARMAAARGVRLVLNARNEQTIRRITDDLNARHGAGRAVCVAGDVSNEQDVHRLAQTGIDAFGGFDTWVNNAGVSIYGRLDEVPMEDHRRLFETNFWGLVHGSRIAIQHFAERLEQDPDYAGALINIGSTLSDRAIPLQGMYCASKHAVKGFTDALRMEVEEQGLPVVVTLIKPSAIDTPYRQHAKNYMETEPLNPPPVYAPETVARAILHCATRPTRDLFVGSGGKIFSVFEKYAPRTLDKVMEATMFDMQKSGRPKRALEDNSLYGPGEDGSERGGYSEYGMVRKHSLYTAASSRPLLSLLTLVGTALAIAGIITAMQPPPSRRLLQRRPASALQRLLG